MNKVIVELKDGTQIIQLGEWGAIEGYIVKKNGKEMGKYKTHGNALKKATGHLRNQKTAI